MFMLHDLFSGELGSCDCVCRVLGAEPKRAAVDCWRTNPEWTFGCGDGGGTNDGSMGQDAKVGYNIHTFSSPVIKAAKAKNQVLEHLSTLQHTCQSL